MKIPLRAKITLSFGVALLLLGILGIASYRSTSRMVESAAWIAHTNSVLADIGTISADLRKAEQAARENAHQPQTRPGNAYAAAAAEIRAAEGDLRHLTAGDAEQRRSLDSLDVLLGRWASFEQESFSSTAKPDEAAALSGQRADLLDHIESVLKEMQDREREGLVARSEKSLAGARRIRVLGMLVTALAFLLVAGSLVLIQRDISERERTEATVKQEKDFSEALIRSSIDGILAYDRDFRFTVWNPGMERLWGLAKEDVLGKSALDVFPFLVETGVRENMAEALAGRNATAIDQPFTIPQTGKSGYFEGAYSPLRDGAGQIIGGLGVIRDVTERKQAEESLRRLSAQLLRAQESERRRIARELHDSTGQRLAALAMNLSWLQSSGNFTAEKAPEILGESRELVDQSVQEIRTLSYLLHPPLLEELGLASTVSWYVQGFTERSGIDVDLEIAPDLGRLGRKAELASFRVVQEGLTNVQRHSGSRKAKVRIERQPSGLVVEVIDEGHGMPMDGAEGKPAASRIGVGIAGMQERLRELGGKLDIHSSKTGTTIRASIPLRERT